MWSGREGYVWVFLGDFGQGVCGWVGRYGCGASDKWGRQQTAEATTLIQLAANITQDNSCTDTITTSNYYTNSFSLM